jgi:hypothetical protein
MIKTQYKINDYISIILEDGKFKILVMGFL